MNKSASLYLFISLNSFISVNSIYKSSCLNGTRIEHMLIFIEMIVDPMLVLLKSVTNNTYNWASNTHRNSSSNRFYLDIKCNYIATIAIVPPITLPCTPYLDSIARKHWSIWERVLGIGCWVCSTIALPDFDPISFNVGSFKSG